MRSIIVDGDMKEPHQSAVIGNLLGNRMVGTIDVANGSETPVRKTHKIVRKRAGRAGNVRQVDRAHVLVCCRLVLH